MTRFSMPESQYHLQSKDSLVVLVLLALVVGVLAGFVGAVFRITLQRADQLRDNLIAWAHGGSFAGFLFIVGLSAASPLIAAWLARRFSPHASGSGIPHVEAVLHGQVPPAPYGLVPIKFVGGILAIGSGLALGREGPTVQMGSSIAHFVGQVFRRDWPDCRVLIAAGAGAGLATAFNAPIAGAIFVLEELVQKFEHRIAIAALAASATAIAVARTLLPDAPDLIVAPLSYGDPLTRPLFFVLGGVVGLLAVTYNSTLLATIAAAERLKRLPVEARAGLIGAAVGTLGWFVPTLIGGGDAITQSTLANTETLTLIPVAFLVRFLLGPVSYAASTPGGLFAPLLTVGAQSGLLFGAACHFAFPSVDIQPEAFAVVGMAAFFTGVVRAPLTGIVLVTEMTASVTMLLPMLGACCVAMLVPTLMRNAPIYDSLRERTLRSERGREGEIGRKQTFRAKD